MSGIAQCAHVWSRLVSLDREDERRHTTMCHMCALLPGGASLPRRMAEMACLDCGSPYCRSHGTPDGPTGAPPRLIGPVGSPEHGEAYGMLLIAALKAVHESKCGRSRCAAIIVDARMGDELADGVNGPAAGSAPRCGRKSEIRPGFKSDRTCCVHAEQRAIMRLIEHREAGLDFPSGGFPPGRRLRMYFARAASGIAAEAADEATSLRGSEEAIRELLEPSGPPYCTICSKMALDAGIAEWCLMHPGGIYVYDALDYDARSFAYDGEISGWEGPL